MSNKKSEKIKREVNVMEQFEDGNAVPLIEVINFNYKKLTNRIDTIRRILKLLSASIDCKSETKSLLIIKEQYEKMYIAIVRSGEYQKYSKVEDIIIGELAKIELNLEYIVYKTARNYESIFNENLARLKENIHFNEPEELYKKIVEIESTKELLNLYSPYINKQARCTLKGKIASLKFNLLLRNTLKGFMEKKQMKYESCFVELIEEIATEVQKIYDNTKTNGLEQKVYDIEISNEEQIEKLFQDFISRDDMDNEANKIYETLLEKFLKKIRSCQNFRKANELNSQIKKIDMVEKILEEYVKYVSE